MIINGKDIDVNELINDVNDDNKSIKMRGKGIYLSDDEVSVLNTYGIDYRKYASLNNLIFDIEEVLNEDDSSEDLEAISKRLSELNYYNNTNK